MRIILNKIISFFGKEKLTPKTIGIPLIFAIFAFGKMVSCAIIGNIHSIPDYVHITLITMMMWISFIAWCIYKKGE